MLMFDTVVQTQFGSFFKAFALPTDVKPTTGVAPGSKIEEFNPVTGAVDTYRWNGESWAKIDANGTAAGSVPAVATEDKGKFLHANESTGALEWAEASGGSGGVFVVGYTYNGDSLLVLDKTIGEIVAAAAPVVVLTNPSGETYFVSSVWAPDDGYNGGLGAFTVMTGTNLLYKEFVADSNGVLTEDPGV